MMPLVLTVCDARCRALRLFDFEASLHCGIVALVLCSERDILNAKQQHKKDMEAKRLAAEAEKAKIALEMAKEQHYQQVQDRARVGRKHSSVGMPVGCM